MGVRVDTTLLAEALSRVDVNKVGRQVVESGRVLILIKNAQQRGDGLALTNAELDSLLWLLDVLRGADRDRLGYR